MDNFIKNKIRLILNEYEDRFIFHLLIDIDHFTIYLMEKAGKAFATSYIYNNDPSAILFSGLSVDSDFQHYGYASILFDIHHKLGKRLGATDSYLWVVKNTWMHEWYCRLGYEYYGKYEADPENTIWLKKTLTTS